MSRFKLGWELTKKSWALLRSNKELFRFPIYGGLLAIAIVIVLVGPGLFLIDDGQRVVGGLLTALGLYGASFVAVYFGVALAATADKVFHGQPATISDGLAVSRERIGAIAGWAALAALVGTLISLIQQSGSIGEAIIGSLIGAAWSLITFLAIPVITFEGTGPLTTLKRSTSLFKERWKGQVSGNIAIGGIVGLLGVLPAVALIAGGAYLWVSSDNGAGAVLVLAGVVLLVAAMLIIQAMRGVFGVALYRFAAEGEVTTGFTQADFESAVKVK
ncbi:MAG: hypothetical protein QOI10_99 [Solirubrobacterales bacterium]|nr:hypothetical protein [Solirubrobacterales bacterium]